MMNKHIECLTKVFSTEEIREIQLNRMKFEEQLRKTNEKNIWFAYIKYEIMLWRNVYSKTRSDDLHFHKPLAQHIMAMHDNAMQSHRNDLRLWLSYIKFCMESNITHYLTDIFEQMLHHHKNDYLWVLAAKWELDEHANIATGLDYLYRGLHYHPQSIPLCSEIFQLELESSNQYPDIFTHEVALVNITKVFNDCRNGGTLNLNLFLNLLDISLKYDFATDLQTEIVKFIHEKFSNNEKMWESFAKYELDGIHFSEDFKYTFIDTSSADVGLQNLIKKFEEAVEIVNTEDMWSKYINTIYDLREDSKYDNQLLKEAFTSACLKAHNLNLLASDMYIKWMDLTKDDPELLAILTEATKKNPKCIHLWVARIRYHLSYCPTVSQMNREILKIFDEAIHILKDESLQIWQLKIQYYQINLGGDQRLIEKIFKDGINFSPVVANVLKPQYLDWIVLFSTQKDPLIEYKKLAKLRPWCIELHKKMLDFQCMVPQPDEDVLSVINLLANAQFGSKWKEYVNEEINSGEPWKKDVFTKYMLEK